MSIFVLIFSAVIGAILGSFTNVLISRGPRKWGLVEAGEKPKGLLFPGSQCEGCQRRLKPWRLVPVVSYLAARGRCAACDVPIGARHLIVECLGIVIVVAAVAIDGVTLDAATKVLLFFTLTALAAVDFESGFLPDALTIPLIAFGLIAAAWGIGPSVAQSALGAMIGGGTLWLIAAGYEALRGRMGLGGGDIKLMAAGGAWLGPFALPFVLLAASVSGLLFVAFTAIRAGKTPDLAAELRFGPFLSAAIAAVVLLAPRLGLF
ncbi:MAG: prepilin peptidase [Pseudomonadota bacterium]